MEVIIGVILVAAIILLVIPRIYMNRWAEWTGFGGKTLWDILQLLIVPAILAFGAFFFEQSASDREDRLQEARAVAESTVEASRLQENILQAYLDDMTNLILEKSLPSCSEEAETSEAQRALTIAETRTKVVLRQIDGSRSDEIVRFLSVAGLSCLIDDQLKSLNLGSSSLDGLNLSGFDLRNIDFGSANMSGTDLRNTDLRGANLALANLTSALFTRTTKLPDGNRWTPEDDLARFTDPTHPNFWRSSDPASPAYAAVNTDAE